MNDRIYKRPQTCGLYLHQGTEQYFEYFIQRKRALSIFDVSSAKITIAMFVCSFLFHLHVENEVARVYFIDITPSIFFLSCIARASSSQFRGRFCYSSTVINFEQRLEMSFQCVRKVEHDYQEISYMSTAVL